jgi:serine/threonine protein kinase
MEILLQLLKDVAVAAEGITGAYTVSSLLVKVLRTRATNKKIAELRIMLQQLGMVTPAAIGDLVKQLSDTGIVVPASAEGPGRRLKCSKDAAARIADVLLNLARGARVLTSRGTPRGTLLEYRSLIDDLLRTLDPVRKAGEPVAAGHEDWVLKRFLGMGSFGEVWLGTFRPGKDPKSATPPNRHMIRAFKFFTQDGARQAMLTELHGLTSALSAIGNDPHIVQFYNAAVDDQKYPFLALEYVAGGTLEDWIVEHPEQRVPLKKNEVMRGIVSALAHAHEYGIYHHDIKPGNILLSERFEPDIAKKVYDVQPKIADFGLAIIKTAAEMAVAHGEGAEVSNKSTNATPGTSMYLPPEADQPFHERKVAQDDIFALGVTWYQLLVEKLERPPYDFADKLREIGVDSQFVHLISRCLANPKRRYDDAQQLDEDLDRVGDLPLWDPAPKGFFNVSQLVREYVATSA